MADNPNNAPMTDDELEALLAEPPSWPKVVGILSIVFGALAFTCTGIGMGALAFMPGIMENVAANTDYPPPPMMQATPTLWALTAVGVIINILLLVAGVMTLARKARGRQLHLLYAFLAIPLTFLSTFIQMNMQADVNEQMAAYVEQYPDSPFAQGAAQGPAQEIGQLVGMAFGLVFALAWPIFCLIWFTLSQRGKSDMKGTGLEAAA